MDEQPLRWAINTVDQLPIFMHGRVELLGDAVGGFGVSISKAVFN